MNFYINYKIILKLSIILLIFIYGTPSYAQIKIESEYKEIKTNGQIYKLKISKNAKIIAYISKVGSGEDKVITILRVNNRLVEELFKIKLKGLSCNFDISPTSDKIIVAYGANKYELWDIEKEKKIKTWDSQHECSDIIFTNDGCFFLELNAGSWGRQPTKLFELSSGKEVYRFQPSYHAACSAYFSEDGSKIYFGGEGEIYIVDSFNGQIIKKFEGYHGGLSCNVKYNVFMDKILSYNRQFGSVNIINSETGKIEKYLTTDDYRYDYSFSPDNKYVVHSVDNIICLYSAETNLSKAILDTKEKLFDFKISSDFSFGVGYNDRDWGKIYIIDLTDFSIDSKLYNERFGSLRNNLDMIYNSITPRDEFETIEQFQERIAIINKKINEANDDNMNLIAIKKGGILNSENEKIEKVNDLINASIRDTTLKIESIGRYNIDEHLLPITIAGITKSISISSEDAKNLKTNLSSSFVRSKKKLNQNLKDWMVYDFIIVDVVANKEYNF